MRIDFIFGTETNSIDHLPSEIAALLLGRNISRKTFGDAFNWLYIVTRATPGKKAPKMTWRWPKSRNRHVVVENDVLFPGNHNLRDSVIALLESTKDIAFRLAGFIDKNLHFDQSAFIGQIEKTIAELPSDNGLKSLAKNLESEHRQRMGEVMYGFEAFRALEKKAAYTTRLSWVRLYCVGSHAGKWSQAHKKEISLVGHMVACALRHKIMTPGYTEIYINLGADEVEVRADRCGLEDWNENAYAVLPASALLLESMPEFRKRVLEVCKRALQKMAANEGLDTEAIEHALDSIDVESLATVFELERITHKHLEAWIEYDFLHRRDDRAILQPVFRLCVLNNDNGKMETFNLGPGDLWKMERVFSKIAVKMKSAQIEVVATPASGAKSQSFDISALLS